MSNKHSATGIAEWENDSTVELDRLITTAYQCDIGKTIRPSVSFANIWQLYGHDQTELGVGLKAGLETIISPVFDNYTVTISYPDKNEVSVDIQVEKEGVRSSGAYIIQYSESMLTGLQNAREL